MENQSNNQDIIEIIALPFKSRNIYSLTKRDFIFSLSFDLGLFPPTYCESILNKGLNSNLLSEKDEIIRPSISVLNVKAKINYLELKKEKRV